MGVVEILQNLTHSCVAFAMINTILENFTNSTKRAYKLLGTTFKSKDDTKTVNLIDA